MSVVTGWILQRPDDGNWRSLSARERQYLEYLEKVYLKAAKVDLAWLPSNLTPVRDVEHRMDSVQDLLKVLHEPPKMDSKLVLPP